jgi:hypothetical protein
MTTDRRARAQQPDVGQSQPDAFPLYDVDQPAGAISKASQPT